MLVCPGFEFEEASKHSIHLGCQCVQVLSLNITRTPMEVISFRTVEDGGKSTTMKTGPELKLWVKKLMFTFHFYSSLLLIGFFLTSISLKDAHHLGICDG